MSKDTRIAEKIAKWAEGELEDAREFAKANPEQQQLARQMARDAKRRHAKANRRAGRALCREFTQDCCS